MTSYIFILMGTTETNSLARKTQSPTLQIDT